MPLQQLYHRGGGGDCPALAVFGGDKAELSRLARDILELLVNADRPPLQIYTVPGKPTGFSPAHTGKKHGQVDGLIAVAMYRRYEGPHSLIVQRLDFLPLHPGKLAGVGGIESEIAQLHGLLESLVEHAVDVLHGFRRQARLAVPLGS